MKSNGRKKLVTVKVELRGRLGADVAKAARRSGVKPERLLGEWARFGLRALADVD